MDQTRPKAYAAAIALGAVAGVLLMAVVGGVRQDPLAGWVIGGALGGAAVGALAAPAWWQRRSRNEDPYVVALPDAERGRFFREARKGPVPVDPERRAAAVRVLRRRLDNLSKPSGVTLLIALAWPVFAVVFVFRGEWLLAGFGAISTAGSVDRWLAPKRAVRRLAELRTHPGAADAGPAGGIQPG